MARRRMIDPAIWQSEDFAKLTLLARLLFIGMFSLADDEGKGRAKPIYLKSVIFPYEEDLRLIDVEKALSEIGTNMSVTLYSHDGSDYYLLKNWDKWQRVDKPQPSKIPFPESLQNDSRIIPESFQNHSCLKEKKEKENNIFSSDTQAYRLCEVFRKCLDKNNPNRKQETEARIQAWCKEFDLLLRIDKRDFDDVIDLIKFTQWDSFEKTVVLSPRKLRERYDQLSLKRERADKNGG